MKTGDCIVWHGGWHSIIEWVYVQGIKVVAGAPTHISTVIVIDGVEYVWESYAWGQCLHLLESRLATAAGEHWKYWQWIPLSLENRERLNTYSLVRYCLDKLGTPYNIIGGVRAGFRCPQPASYSKKLFCSSSHIFALQSGGLFCDKNANAFTPKDVVELL